MGWLFEQGIGEERAILVEDGEIVETLVQWPTPLGAGAIVQARLRAILIPGRRGIVEALATSVEALIEPIPAGVTEGALLTVEVLREAMPEAGRDKLAKVRATDRPQRAARTLAERVGAAPKPALPGSDPFEAAGWSQLLEEARTGEIPFDGGALRMSVTPAMTLFDVDGPLPPATLAVAGAGAAGQAIRRLAIGGSIGIDLPTLSDKSERQAAAAALDYALPQPFERTAVNGFGFLQVVRRRERPSLPELVRADPAGAAARALLRRAEREPGGGAITLVAATPVIARIEREAGWIAQLERRIGGPAALSADPALPIFGAYAHRRP